MRAGKFVGLRNGYPRVEESKRQRITYLAGTAFLILIFVIVGWTGYLVRSPMPLVHGRVEVDGFAGSVEIYRDD